VPELTDSDLRAMFRLPDDADLGRAFSDLDVDSWDLIEVRTILETRHDIRFTDDKWMELERPSDILLRRSAA
jgi:hypothetical protein